MVALKELLAEELPKDVPFTFYHYSTPPSKSLALFSAPPRGKPEPTYCESHFVAASIGSETQEELLILALEVLVYSTANLTTIFVSKADSTGYLSELELPRTSKGSRSPLKAICGTFVSWLAKERLREGRKLVVSLFARAQDQYLFPSSIENKKKHVLDDRGLIKWWCKVLDPIIWQYKTEDQLGNAIGKSALDAKSNDGDGSPRMVRTAKGYLVIPGFESHDTMRCAPPSSPSAASRHWTAAHPLLQIAPDPAAPPRCLIPRFPDDPKSRFFDELDEELSDRGTDTMTAEGTSSARNGQWKSVKTLDQFWELMAFRQECSSGRIVGFVWIVITPHTNRRAEDIAQPSQESCSHSLSESGDQDRSASSKRSSKHRKQRRDAHSSRGPIPLVFPRIKSSSPNASCMSSASRRKASVQSLPRKTAYYIWPPSSRGTICFSSKDYARAHEILLHQSFCNRAAAVRSTRKWKEEVAILGGAKDWSWHVVGKKETAVESGRATTEATSVAVVGVRRKRKPSQAEGQKDWAEETAVGRMQSPDGEVSTSKKTAIDRDSVVTQAGGVNTLSATLVRKKPKIGTAE